METYRTPSSISNQKHIIFLFFGNAEKPRDICFYEPPKRRLVERLKRRFCMNTEVLQLNLISKLAILRTTFLINSITFFQGELNSRVLGILL